MSRCTMATMLPRVWEQTAIRPAASSQRGETVNRSIPSTTRSSAISAAPLGTTERNAVTGVGPPW